MTINIGTMNVDRLYVTPEALEQVEIGATPQILRDIGHSIPDTAADIVASREQPPTPEEEVEILQARAAGVKSVEPHIKPYVRKAHLLKAIKIGAKLRMYRGGITTHQETSINYMEVVEDCLETAEENFSASLVRACSACAFRGQCKLEGRPDAWLETHPTAKDQVTNKQQQSVPEFKESLDLDPMGHCVPAKNKYHQRNLELRRRSV